MFFTIPFFHFAGDHLATVDAVLIMVWVQSVSLQILLTLSLNSFFS